MADPVLFFYLTLASVVFFIASSLAGHGRRGGRSGRRGGVKGRRHGKSDRIGIWSLNTILLFFAGFGIGGFFATVAGAPLVATLAAAGTTGCAFVLVDYALLKFLHARQYSSARRIDDYVGLTATVDISILAGGVGRISCRREGETTTLAARSEGADLPVHSLVRIKSVSGAVAIVEANGDAGSLETAAWKGYLS